jgi:hypothetical protein
MGITERAKELADAALLKAGELSEVAREKAPGYLDKAADVTVKAVDAAASGVDRVTGGRFHDKLEDVTTKVEEGLDRPRPTTPTTTASATIVEEAGTTPTTPTPTPASVADEGEPPITPAATNPEATGPDTTPKS